MTLLIDGYNVLHVAGVLHRGVGLARARQALLNFIADHIASPELTRTTVVFDAKDAPPGLPRQLEHRGMTVRFASGHDDADELLEELIRADSAPRKLTVVSSDRRVQRAARRRRARAVASDAWYYQLLAEGPAPLDPTGSEAKPALPLSPADVQQWLQQFAQEKAHEGEQAADTSAAADQGTPQGKRPPLSKPSEPWVDEITNPFPPGYGEDLLE